MKSKSIFWLSLALAVGLAGNAVDAYAAQQNSAPPPQAAQPALPHMDLDQKNAQRAIASPYRLTYTLTEMDGTKRIGSQRYAIVLLADRPHSHLKIDSSIPVLDSKISSLIKPTYSREHADLIIDATLRQRSNGLELITDIMQLAFSKEVGQEQAADVIPPVTRDSVFTTTALLIENKPLVLGQLDMPGSTHSLQIQVVLSELR